MGKRRRRRSLFSRTPKPVTTSAAHEGGVALPKLPPRYAPVAASAPSQQASGGQPPAPPPPAAPPAPPPRFTTPPPATVVAPKMSRAERRRQQRQRQRRRRFSAVGVLAVVGAIIAVAVIVGLATHHGKGKGAGAGRTQRTLLLQVIGPDGSAVDSALLAHDPATKRGVVLLVPSRVIADIPGHGDAAFGTATQVGPPSLAQATLSDLVGVTIDGTVVYSERAFARLINSLGGITADVDRDVTVKASNGTHRVVVARGAEQHLAGAASVAYATFNTGGPAGELAKLTRLESVLNGLLAKSTTPAIFSSAMANVGTLGVLTTMPMPQLADLIAGVSADANADAVDYRTLDVKPVDTGGAPIYSLDRPKVQQFVAQSLRASIPKGLLSGGNTVLVKNGVGTPQLGRSTRDRLLHGGFVYVDGGNVPGFPYRNQLSVVVVFSTSQTAIDRGNRVAKALNLPVSDVRVSRLGQSVADVIVLLGKDYRR
jgi:anionic cell wall polymer biosynthesis LytR-Cps2A-Psr (LCP) family protein